MYPTGGGGGVGGGGQRILGGFSNVLEQKKGDMKIV